MKEAVRNMHACFAEGKRTYYFDLLDQCAGNSSLLFKLIQNGFTANDELGRRSNYWSLEVCGSATSAEGKLCFQCIPVG